MLIGISNFDRFQQRLSAVERSFVGDFDNIYNQDIQKNVKYIFRFFWIDTGLLSFWPFKSVKFKNYIKWSILADHKMNFLDFFSYF